uniref:Uncharacterized protein n=1 Tax=Arundo donax TaxID=35708 RepID=A0A0A9AGM8_ARUDO
MQFKLAPIRSLQKKQKLKNQAN